MKKYLPLLAVLSCSLTGCSKEISSAEAAEIANDIRNTVINPETIDTIKVNYSASDHIEGTNDSKVVDNKDDISYKFEASNKRNYLHMLFKTKSKDKIEDETTSDERELWIYIKNKTLYQVNRVKSVGSETKKYTKIDNYGAAATEFVHLYNTYISTIYEAARGYEYLDLDKFTNIFGEEYRKDIEFSEKYFSKKEGNLRVATAAKIDKTYETGVYVKGVGTATVKWNEYLLKSAASAYTLKVSDGTNKNDYRRNYTLTHNVSKFFIATYPNLNKYALENR